MSTESRAQLQRETSPELDNIRLVLQKKLEFEISRCEAVEPLLAAVRHVLFPGGKRIRPLLCLSLVHGMNGSIEAVAGPACALEMLHASTLVHDDLPAIDNDDFRRGRPTCHREFGEATAILSGDFLAALALRTVGRADLPDTVRALMSECLSDAYLKICNGQQLDMLEEKRRGDLLTLHDLKTGALFSATCAFAAMGCGQTAQTLEVFKRLGLTIGKCFQIIDDYKDAFGTDKERGRPSSSDARNHKSTFFSEGASVTTGMQILSKEHERLDYDLAAAEKVSCGNFAMARELIAGIFLPIGGIE